MFTLTKYIGQFTPILYTFIFTYNMTKHLSCHTNVGLIEFTNSSIPTVNGRTGQRGKRRRVIPFPTFHQNNCAFLSCDNNDGPSLMVMYAEMGSSHGPKGLNTSPPIVPLYYRYILKLSFNILYLTPIIQSSFIWILIHQTSTNH